MTLGFRVAGHRGVLVECADLAEVMALHRALRAAPPPGVVDLVPAARTLLVTLDTHGDREAVERAVLAADLTLGEATGDEPEVVLPVVYDGPDLDAVAQHTGLPRDEVIRRHADAAYVVAFVGFAPGFAYLAGGDPALAVPRRATPRTRVPAGSVAVAGDYTGVYPRAGPGGWQLLGHTETALWDLDREPPALLGPGTRVRLRRLDGPA